MENSCDLESLEKKIKIKFKNKKFLEQALTHKSYGMTHPGIDFNERLEFLGDSVLNTAVTDFLYKRFPNEDEGKLSKYKSLLVSKPSLFRWAKDFKIGAYLKLSENELLTGGRERETILADALEAVIGAIYLDQGFEKASALVKEKCAEKKRIIQTDYKSKLQEIIQKKHKIPPTYSLLKETGPDHEKIFQIDVRIKKKKLGVGQGRSKKEAEQSAAHDALKKIKNGGAH
ncbi:MAG: ribonuclease III [Elusimicrobia bacterium]|nr:ribonuclease III [Elusimicrobiota bacterium]